MQHSVQKETSNLFSRALLGFVTFLLTACTPLIHRPTDMASLAIPTPESITMPSLLLTPDKTQTTFTSYCVEYRRDDFDDPNIRLQIAWQKTEGTQEFNSCAAFYLKVDSTQPAILVSAACAVNDTTYYYMAPSWQVNARTSAKLPIPPAIDDPAGNGLSTFLDWPIDQLVSQSSPVGSERVSGQVALHYQVQDLELLSKLSIQPSGFSPPQTGKVDLWIAPSSGTVLKYKIDLASDWGIDRRSFTLSQINQPMQIHPPPQAVEYQQKSIEALARNHAILPMCYACAIPIPPGGVVEAPGMMTSNLLQMSTPKTAEEVVTYYEQQLPREGWHVKTENNGDESFALTLTRSDQQVSIQIFENSKNSPTIINISGISSASTDLSTTDPVDINQYCPQ